jgi:hypothetical protein
MDTASLELSKDLYALSGWGRWPDPTNWYSKHGGLNHSYMPANLEVERGYVPAYDLGYLMRKFAGKGGIELRHGDQGCVASSHLWYAEADTPEDTVAKLAIELFKCGVLKRV